MHHDPEHHISFFNVHAKWRNAVKFFATIIDTLSPATYHILSKQPAQKAWHYFHQLIFFSFFIMILLSLPGLWNLQDKLNEETMKLTEVTINPTVEIDELISFYKGDIIITNEKEYNGETLLVTKAGIYLKNQLCLLSPLGCYIDDTPMTMNGEKAQKLFDNKQDLSKVFFALFLLILPGLLIALYLFFFIKYLVLIVVIAFAGYLVCAVTRHKIGWKEVLLISIYSSTLVVLPTVALGFFINLYYIPLAVYILMFIVALIVVGRRSHSIWH